MKTPQFWQSHNLLSVALIPASWLYALGAWIDRSLTKPKHAPIPVIAIGNVTAGGAGKSLKCWCRSRMPDDAGRDWRVRC